MRSRAASATATACASSTGAASADFARGAGDGGALGLGTAIARGGIAVAWASGVSEGFGEVFLCGLGDLSVFFFFFPFGEVSFAGDFFVFAFWDASGVSPGAGEASDASLAVFFFLRFADGDGDNDFFFLWGDDFDLGVGVGDSESTARAFRIGLPSSVCCACETKTLVSAPSAQNVVNQTRKRTTERSVTECFARSTRQRKTIYAGSAAG